MILARLRRRPRRRAHTLVEILVVFALSAVCLGILYDMWHTGWFRVMGVSRRAEGEMAVRILLARVRQELRHAIAPVEASNFGTSSLAIPLLDPVRERDDPLRRYYSKYIFDKETSTIVYEKWPADSLDQGAPVERRTWLGGNTPVAEFQVRHTSENERILFQYYRVIVDVSYYDVKIKDSGKGADAQRDPANLISISATVYPRRINQELRIEVPQEGSYL